MSLSPLYSLLVHETIQYNFSLILCGQGLQTPRPENRFVITYNGRGFPFSRNPFQASNITVLLLTSLFIKQLYLADRASRPAAVVILHPSLGFIVCQQLKVKGVLSFLIRVADVWCPDQFWGDSQRNDLPAIQFLMSQEIQSLLSVFLLWE